MPTKSAQVKQNRPRALIHIPGYKREDYDAQTGVLTVHIGEVIFETGGGNGLRYHWRARHEKSEAWSDSKRRFAVLAGSSGWYKHRGRAERAMREFILAAYGEGAEKTSTSLDLLRELFRLANRTANLSRKEKQAVKRARTFLTLDAVLADVNANR